MALEAMSKTSGFNITWYIDAVLKYAYTYDQKMKNESSKIFLVIILFIRIIPFFYLFNITLLIYNIYVLFSFFIKYYN